jgi:hypothetical protein
MFTDGNVMFCAHMIMERLIVVCCNEVAMPRSKLLNAALDKCWRWIGRGESTLHS